MTTTTDCFDCGTAVPRGLGTVRTTLSDDPMPVLTSLAWCRTCLPVRVPSQRAGR